MDDHLLVFGNGYTGAAIAAAAREAGIAATVTSRTPDRPGIVRFDAAGEAVARATHVVSTAPPGTEGDPVLAAYGAEIGAARGLRWVGYLSTTGVYGDRGGGWVDETSVPAPGSDRARRRVAAEDAWRAACRHVALDLFRVAGIYGPGRSAIDDLRAGRARVVRRPGHAFGRVHREDIAGAVLAAARQARPAGARVLHLADDLPAESAEVIAEAARLLGVPCPPARDYALVAGEMGEMARSFWSENRRVASRITQAVLARPWLYPSYREGLRAILAAERQHDAQDQGEVGGP